MLLIIVGAVIIIGMATYTVSALASEHMENKYDKYFAEASMKYNVDAKMLKRIAWIESRVGRNERVARGIKEPKNIEASKSYDGLSWGIMQVTVTTARDYDKDASPEKLNNPSYSIDMGARHLAFLKKSYPQFSERDLVMSYNHGQGNQLRFLQLESQGKLQAHEFKHGRDYWNLYLQAKEYLK